MQEMLRQCMYPLRNVNIMGILGGARLQPCTFRLLGESMQHPISVNPCNDKNPGTSGGARFLQQWYANYRFPAR